VENRINYKDFIKVYLRSFLYQNLMNLKNFQNFGFMYVLYPIIKKFNKSKNDIVKQLLQNFEYFNTNPYFASFVFGVSMNLIESHKENELNKFKFDVMSPLAGLGDAFVWGIVRPFLVLISAGFILMNIYWGWLIFFLGFNITVNIFFRLYGIILGYKYGINVIFNIAKMNLQNAIHKIKQISLIIWGGMFYLIIVYRYKIFQNLKGSFEVNEMDVYKLGIIVLFIFIYYFLNKKFIPVVTYVVYIISMILLYLIYR